MAESYKGPSKQEKKHDALLNQKKEEVMAGRDTVVRRFGSRSYLYGGAMYPSGARWYQRRWGDRTFIRKVSITLKGKIVGYHIWLADKPGR